jgi:small subunit ribosomal protein S12e
MCAQAQIPLIKVEDSRELGEWAGLCKIDSEGKAVKIVSCSCVVIKSWGEESPARLKVLEHVKSQ